MKPIIEPSAKDGPSVGTTDTNTSSGGLLGKLVGITLLVCIAIGGFGWSAGWFDAANAPEAARKPPLPSNSTAAKTTAISQGAKNSAPTPTSPAPPPTGTLPAQANPDSAATTAMQPGTDSSSLPRSLPGSPPLSAIAPDTSEAILQEARQVAEHLAEAYTTSVEAREMLARYEYQFGDVENARKLWTDILQETPEFVYALRGLGDVCTINGELEEAVEYFRKAADLEPANPTRRITLGVALVQAAQLNEAREVFEQVLAEQPQHVGAHAELGSLLTQLKEYEAAKVHLETALAGQPGPADPAKVHFSLVTVFQRTGDRDQAKFHLAEHNRLKGLTEVTRTQGRKEYDDVAAIGIDVARLYVDMARVYLAMGNATSAELLLLRAARMNAKDLDCRQALAFLAAQQNKSFDAIRWLKEVSELRPDEFSYVREIARLYLQTSQVDDAERTLTEFVVGHGKNAIALDALARFYVEVKPIPERAIKHAVLAAETSGAAASYAYLASVYQASERFAEAMQALDTAIDLAPDNTEYREAKIKFAESNAAPSNSN